MAKEFFWKDKTGRGYTNTFSLEEIKKNADEDDTNWDGDLLSEWAEDADEGDEWENATEKYVCTKV